jgi:hypothetical protein
VGRWGDEELGRWGDEEVDVVSTRLCALTVSTARKQSVSMDKRFIGIFLSWGVKE